MSLANSSTPLSSPGQSGAGQPIGEVMTTPVRFIAATTPVLTAISKAREWGIHHLPVGTSKAPEGLVCTCDLKEAPLDGEVWNWVNSPVLTVSAGTPIVQAATLMRHHVVGSLLVTDRNTVCGIVTRADLARLGGDGTHPITEIRCVCCGATSHLRLDGYDQLLCVDCRERADEPQAFDTGGGD